MDGHRQTLQQEIVFQEVLKLQGHATADMIYEKIHALHPSISKATVYRNLKKLEGQGKIMRIDASGRADYFEVRKKEHYHIKCVNCGRLFDALFPYMPQLLEKARETEVGFRLLDYTLLLEGICPDCSEEKKIKGKIGGEINE
ncbi:MAG: Fur family transcriptional regulator [Roseburia sp.]